MASGVSIRRVYDDPGPGEGYRVLVDRVWPRGVSKDELQADEWFREVAPSTELRRWYGHEVEKWEEFRRRYRQELAGTEAAAALERLVERARNGHLTLLYGARDGEHSQAEVLRELIEERLRAG
ncbi:MAG: DUF488 domain-containing protein [Hyphomicrobiales bacterium]